MHKKINAPLLLSICVIVILCAMTIGLNSRTQASPKVSWEYKIVDTLGAGDPSLT